MAENRESHLSRHELSMIYKKKTAEELLDLQTIYKYVTYFWIPLCVAVIVMSSLWSDIQGKKAEYTKNNVNNTQASDYWQACLVQADYQYIAIAENIKIQTDSKVTQFGTCLLNILYSPSNPKGVCTTDCFMGVLGCTNTLKGSSITDIGLPTGHYLGGLSYIGIQAVIFSGIAHAAMNRALRHPSWLMSTIALMFWFVFAIFTYYTVSPILPVATTTNSTLLNYLFYNSGYTKFNNFNNGNNECETGAMYVWVYLSFIVLIGITVFVGGIIGIYAEKIRFKKLKMDYEPLQHTEIPLVLGALAIIFYVILVAAKMLSTFTELNAITAFDYTPYEAAKSGKGIWFPQIYFPFAQPYFDLSTILGVASFMSVLRGYTIQSISAFRMAFVSAFIFTISTYPPIVGAFEFYAYYHFDQYDECYNFFLAPEQAVAFGYPSESQAKLYCQSFRLALYSATGFFISMHLLTVACYFMYTQNSDRDSLVHDEIDFAEIIAQRETERQQSTQSFAGQNPLNASVANNKA